MPRYSFPGYSVFLAEAAVKLGHPEAEGPARGIAALSALGNLCGQAGIADSTHVQGIMAKAAEFRDQLQTAALAADLMIADMERALGLKEESDEEKRPTKPSKSSNSNAKKS